MNADPATRSTEPVDPFVVADCTLTALATGEEAQTLREFRERLKRIPEGSLFYHFWGRLLRPVFEEREFNNDFADWAAFHLQDRILAERLALVDPADYPDVDLLRDEVLELVEERLHEEERSGVVAAGRPFHFIQSQLVVFDTEQRASTPAELADICPGLSRNSVFYHLVDARQRPPHGHDDFQVWLRNFGEEYGEVREKLSQIDVYFSTLDDLRTKVSDVLCQLHDGQVDP